MTQSSGLAIVTGNKLSPSGIEKIADTARVLLQMPISTATKRAYNVQWASFVSFCSSYAPVQPSTSVPEHNPALPASPDLVVAFIADLVNSGKSTSTINQAAAAIAAAHAETGHDDPTKSPVVKRALKNVRLTVGTAPAKKAAVTDQVLVSLLDGVDRKTLQGKRDAAIILLGFFGAFRRSELVALDLEDLQPVTAPNGKKALEITIRHSKTDQESSGMVKAIFTSRKKTLDPIAALNEWTTAAGITSGALFRRVRRGDRPTEERITGQSVALILKKAAAAAGVDLDISGHSLRSGFITSALLCGSSERSVMNQSGHRSTTVMRGYLQRANALLDNAAESLASRI